MENSEIISYDQAIAILMIEYDFNQMAAEALVTYLGWWVARDPAPGSYLGALRGYVEAARRNR